MTIRNSFSHYLPTPLVLAAVIVAGAASRTDVGAVCRAPRRRRHSPAAPVPDALLKKLPEAYREQARRITLLPQETL